MHKAVLPIMTGTILLAAAQGQLANSFAKVAQASQTVPVASANASAQSFAGIWHGSWHNYPEDPDASLSVVLNVKPVDNGKLSGTLVTGAFQHQLAPKQKAQLSLGAAPPHIPPPPPPLPNPPPTGKMLNPRIERGTLVFAVKAPDGKLVDFRLNPQSHNAGILSVTGNNRAYPEFQMRRVQ
jgi:hypothetical protein